MTDCGCVAGFTAATCRLSNVDTGGCGRVEVYHLEQWGTVCDDAWEDADARVACRQLGLGGGTAHGLAYRGEGTGHIWLDEVACSGDEQTLEECAFGAWGDNNCVHGEDASACCGGMMVSGVLVSYRGKEYRTLDAWAPEDGGPVTCQDQFVPLPAGWQLSVVDVDSVAVTAAYPW